jgi:transposase InsO family protein
VLRLRPRDTSGSSRHRSTEKIRREGPWKTLSDVELVTLEWVDWFNNARPPAACGRLSPAQFEHEYLEALQTQ